MSPRIGETHPPTADHLLRESPGLAGWQECEGLKRSTLGSAASEGQGIANAVPRRNERAWNLCGFLEASRNERLGSNGEICGKRRVTVGRPKSLKAASGRTPFHASAAGRRPCLYVGISLNRDDEVGLVPMGPERERSDWAHGRNCSQWAQDAVVAPVSRRLVSGVGSECEFDQIWCASR
jgi:hypothetical protein